MPIPTRTAQEVPLSPEEEKRVLEQMNLLLAAQQVLNIVHSGFIFSDQPEHIAACVGACDHLQRQIDKLWPKPVSRPELRVNAPYSLRQQ